MVLRTSYLANSCSWYDYFSPEEHVFRLWVCKAFFLKNEMLKAFLTIVSGGSWTSFISSRSYIYWVLDYVASIVSGISYESFYLGPQWPDTVGVAIFILWIHFLGKLLVQGHWSSGVELKPWLIDSGRRDCSSEWKYSPLKKCIRKELGESAPNTNVCP